MSKFIQEVLENPQLCTKENFDMCLERLTKDLEKIAQGIDLEEFNQKHINQDTAFNLLEHMENRTKDNILFLN